MASQPVKPVQNVGRASHGSGYPPPRPKPITQQRMRPPPSPAVNDGTPQQPPCPCCSERAATVQVVKHGLQCTGCAYVVWERE